MLLTDRLSRCELLTEVKVLRNVTVCSSGEQASEFRWAQSIELNRAIFSKA